MQTRAILAQNLAALMQHRNEGQNSLKRRSGVSQATIGRILGQKSDADIGTITALAKALDVMPWQMLVPQLDPKNLPVIKMTDEERKLYDRLHALASQIVKP